MVRSAIEPSDLVFQGVQHERLDDSADHAVFRRRVRPQPFLQTSEKSKQLPDDYVDHWHIFVAELPHSFAVYEQVALLQEVSRNRLTNNDFHEAKALLVEFAQQVCFISPTGRIGGEETHDERVSMDVAHGTMAQTEIGLAHGADPSAGHFQHLERGFASCAKTRTAPQEDCTLERRLRHG